MKFGIIKERKNQRDKSVLFSPDELVGLKQLHKDISIKVESSDTRVFTDMQYTNVGIEVTNVLNDCDFLFGINEVPLEYLIPNKSYFFFSHTLKKQPNNKEILQTLLEKNIDFYDYEAIIDTNNNRLIDFGYYAGIVGTYNSIRAFGIKFELFKLPKVETLSGKEALINHLKRLILPPLKIVITANGKFGAGIKEVLDAIKIKQVSVENYLTKNYTQPVYTQIDVLDYYKRIDGNVLDNNDFFNNKKEYVSDFEQFAKVSDIYISAHFHTDEAPEILTQKMLQANDCKIKVVANLSCNVNNSIACVLRLSTIAEPLYGYLPSGNKEVDVFHPAAIVVMAVDNLPWELAKDTCEGFGKIFAEYVIPAFFNGDKERILERAKIIEKGKLSPRFSYLQDYVNGK